MGAMKKWVKRSSVILSLGVLGGLALAMRPALCPDEAVPFCDASCQGWALPPDCPPLDVRYSIDLLRPEGVTCYYTRGGGAPNAFDMLEPAAWALHFQTKDGRLELACNAPVLHAQSPFQQVTSFYSFSIRNQHKEKQPDGSYQTIYIVDAECTVIVTPSFWGDGMQTTLAQSFRVNPEKGIIDPAMPPLAGKDNPPVSRFPVKGLPTHATGSPAETALTEMLYGLGRIDSERSALSAARTLPALANRALPALTDPSKPWPECWGNAAPTARACAKLITPALVYLQEHDCFGCQELADFINGPLFARYFGESFAEHVPDPLDEPVGGFPIEQVPADRFDDAVWDAPETTEP